MPEQTRSSAPARASRSALRVVLFGMPDAGKSSLLGALAQAAQTQEHVLNGHLTDVGHGLADMQRRLYDEPPRNTIEEVLPFPIVFEPFSAKGRTRTEALVVDCDGRVANDLLARRRELNTRGGGELGRAVLAADAVVFVVDVSASTAQIDADFNECARFLRLMESRRGERADVGGLPVFLVLTKCDLLAQPGDDRAAWVEKIEERKRQVGRRFQTFLDEGANAGTLPFGSIQLNVWATSVKRPELSDSPAKPREPYGVAELFRQCFALALEHRQRRGRSGWRLLLTLLFVIAVIGAMATVPIYLMMNRPTEQTTDLEGKVTQFQLREQELAPAARYRQIGNRIDWLNDFRKDKAYGELPDSLKEYVEHRLEDLKEYEKLVAAVDALPDPRTTHNEAQLKAARDATTAAAKTLEAHSDWKSTDAAQVIEERREEGNAVDKAVRDTVAAYDKVIREGQQVLKEKEKANLPTRARKVLDAGRTLPDPKTDADKPVPGSQRVTYGTVLGFDPVKDMIRQWESVRKDLVLPASLTNPE